MSSLEPEADTAEMEENPNPEEDSGLPQRHQLNGDELDVRGKEDYAEEDFAMAEETVDINSHSMSLVEETHVELATASPGVQEHSPVKDVENDSRDIVSSEELSGQMEGDKEQNLSSMTVADLNFFEVVDKTCAAECILNGVKHEACSEIDRQLFISQDTIPNNFSIDALRAVNEDWELQDLKPESESLSVLADRHMNSDIDTTDNLESSCVVSGTVDLNSSLDNKPKGDNLIWERTISSWEEKEDLSLYVGQDIFTASENSQHTTSSCLEEQLDKTILDLCATNAEHIPSIHSNVLAGSEGVVYSVQASGFGSQVVLLNESSNDACHGGQEILLNESSNDICHGGQEILLNESSNDVCHGGQEILLNESSNDICHRGQVVLLNESSNDTCPGGQEILLNESSNNVCHGGQEILLNEFSNDVCHGGQEILIHESSNDTCHADQTVVASELTSTSEDSHNNVSDYPPLTAEQDVPATSWNPVSHDCIEPLSDFETRDSSLEDLSPTVSSCGNNTTVSAFQKITNSCQDEVSRTQDDSMHYSSSPVDDFSTESIDNVPIHQENILHADISSHVLLSQVDSKGKQKQKISEPPCLHTSIPTQEICNLANSEAANKTEDGSFLSSASPSLPTVAIPNINEHRSSDSNVVIHTQASESVSQECLATSLCLTTESSNTFVSSTGESHSSHIGSQSQTLESASEDSSSTSSKQSSPAKTLSGTPPGTFSHSGLEQTSAFQNSNEYEIFQDLRALLLAYTSGTKPLHSPVTDKSGLQENRNIEQSVNGQQQLFDFGQIQDYNRQLLEQMKIRDDEIVKLTCELNSVREARVQSHDEEHILSSSHQADDLYLPQIKVLEHTIAQQQKEIQALKLKLSSQDDAAKRAIISLQNELKSRVSQVTKMYDDCVKEKGVIVIRYAESEAKNMEAKRIVEKSEAKLKEVMKDKDVMMNALKAAKAEKQKAISNFETKCIEISSLQKEVEKLKESITSSEHHTKWFQSKLAFEVEDHKETKNNLEKTAARLKEAREETEIIRKECHAIVKRYQESEEIKSNSLDKELKLKETELRTQLQERNDNEEIHQMLKRELDSLKSQHKDTIEEAKTYKDKVQCLEEERRQNHQMIENYQEIMQRQKTSNAELNIRLASLASLENECKGSQEMLQALQSDVSDLRATNDELQKDMDSCRERESRMLTLQSDLSHANALLRSENTSLNNKISSLTSDLEKLKREVYTSESTNKDLREKCGKEKAKCKEEGEKIAVILAERVKECNDLRQKWEDEMDNSKTLKRRHTSNIKDLTRQLHQVHKRLESIEGKGDSGSMGSRTNSNGSLNSLENSSRPIGHPSVQEFPVITEQVEVDKQVLIERIVRLQKSLARKNEKLEFLGEHIQQLLEDIKKKNKVIQCYALREESGTMSSENMDENKERVRQMYKDKVQKEMQILLSRKGGIMASLYSAQQQDGTMTLELSLQISRKLQAVLEDTLLKNITLKESLDTLGEEIARLSQENRKLQLHLQKIEGSVA